MKTHDCSKCKASGDCPLESLAPWLNEHAEEVEELVQDQAKKIARLCARVAAKHPVLLMCAEEIADLTMMALVIGYREGRTFPVVPEVFEKA